MADAEISRILFELLATRGGTSTLCPSEVARALAPDEPRWRALMPEVRRVVAGLASRGLVRVTSHGIEVDVLEVHGPVRVGLPPDTASGQAAAQG